MQRKATVTEIKSIFITSGAEGHPAHVIEAQP